MWWDLKTASKNLEARNLPKDSLMWCGVICFFIGLFIAVELFFHIVLQFGFWFAFLISVVVFAISFQILSIIGLFFIEKFVRLYKKK